MKTAVSLGLSAITATVLVAATPAFALDGIIRPYQSVRDDGMGGVRYTTGLYEDNFFSNPARVTANPTWRVTLFDPSVEINSQTPNTIGKVTGGGNDMPAKISETAGSNNHARFEMATPAVYLPSHGKWAYAVGLITSVQGDLDLRRNFQGDVPIYMDFGPAITVGRKFLDDNSLSLGVTGHAVYRVETLPEYDVVDALNKTNPVSASNAYHGGGVDFDVGATYLLPVKLDDFDLSVAAAMDNGLGGKYDMFGKTNGTPTPAPQPRSFGLGGSISRATLGPFSEFVTALEFSDIGNNPNGSIFKTVHIGAELHYGVLIPRVGINQGYLAAGLGLNFKFIMLDFATYGEELSDNVGGLEDRRYAFQLSLQI